MRDIGLSLLKRTRKAPRWRKRTQNKNNIIIVHVQTHITHNIYEHLTYIYNDVISLMSLTRTTSKSHLPPILGQTPTILVWGNPIRIQYAMLETNTNPCGYVFCVYVHVNAHNAFEISNHNYWVINGTHFDISKRAFTIKSRPETCIFYTFSGVYFKALNLKLYILKEAKNMFREVHWINFQGLYTDNVLSTGTPWVPVITPPP